MEVAANGNGGAGEVRRLHIIYFLSHMGRVEHPHLIRVHHLTKNGVYLRDVKRWMAEVRGKEMPVAFTWSYKRRYKSGYVWQDLMDDDLITPISDNEYVLKGSESIPYTTFDTSLFGKKNSPISGNDQQPTEVEDQHSPNEETNSKISPEILEESSDVFGSERSSLTDDSMKLQEEDKETVKLSNDIDGNNNNNNNNGTAKTTATMGTPDSSRSSSKSQFAKSKSYSNGASNMLRNLMKCGAVDTNDAVVVTISRGYKPGVAKSIKMQDPGAVICPGDKLEVSARVFATQWNHNQHQQNRARKSFDGMAGSKRKNEFTNTEPVSSAYKPAGAPTCSQCGKSFKPEKMHKHMQSCKGMKRTTANGQAEKTPTQRSFNLSPEKSASGYLLTN